MLKRKICLLMVLMFIFTGCDRVRFTTGLSNGDFARIAGHEISMDIARLLLAEHKFSYEKMFNSEVWNKEINGVTTEKYIKNSVRDTLESIVYARNMAKELKIEITEDESERIKEAAQRYISSLSYEPEAFDVKAVEDFYRELLLAEKGFYAVTDSVDTKVSTDEARMIQVQYIYLSTITYDDNNNQVNLSEGEITLKKEQGQMLIDELKNGAEFSSLAVEYSDDMNYSMELSRGEHCEEFCEAAFALEMGQTSKLVETPYGYYIIKCINYNMECDFDEQCDKIILARRKSVFTEAYLEYANDKPVEYNDDFWDNTPVKELEKGSGELYTIYNDLVQTK